MIAEAYARFDGGSARPTRRARRAGLVAFRGPWLQSCPSPDDGTANDRCRRPPRHDDTRPLTSRRLADARLAPPAPAGAAAGVGVAGRRGLRRRPGGRRGACRGAAVVGRGRDPSGARTRHPARRHARELPAAGRRRAGPARHARPRRAAAHRGRRDGARAPRGGLRHHLAAGRGVRPRGGPRVRRRRGARGDRPGRLRAAGRRGHGDRRPGARAPVQPPRRPGRARAQRRRALHARRGRLLDREGARVAGWEVDQARETMRRLSGLPATAGARHHALDVAFRLLGQPYVWAASGRRRTARSVLRPTAASTAPASSGACSGSTRGLPPGCSTAWAAARRTTWRARRQAPGPRRGPARRRAAVRLERSSLATGRDLPRGPRPRERPDDPLLAPGRPGQPLGHGLPRRRLRLGRSVLPG
jgi:hypothetical protein